MKRNLLWVVVAVAGLAQVASAMTPEERAAYRDKLLQLLPDVPAGRGPGARPAFSEWAKDHLPPDFDTLPKINGLPDPLLFVDGKRVVKTPQDWQERRAEIFKLFETYYFGRVPPKPKLDEVVTVDPAVAQAEAAARGGGRGFGGGRGRGATSGPATAPGAQANAGPTSAPAAGRGRGGGRGPAPGSVTRIVDLKYGPNSQITTRVTLTIPPGPGPFPVIIFGTPDITNRGYISCSTTAASPDNPPAGVAAAYPDYDFGTMGQIAFVTRMVCDYLYTVPEVDKPHIAITGYSRLGKMASICAMYEERITGVLAGSTGVGGVLPWRMGGERGSAEGIESMTRSYSIYFAPQLRWFSGRDDKLPVDGNLIVAMIAPRSILSFYGESDEVGNIYGNEASANSAQRAFDILGAPKDHNAILHVPGHHGAGGNDPRVMQWLDIQFGKSTEKWESHYLYPWDYNKWRNQNKDSADISRFAAQDNTKVLASVNSTADWEKKAADVRKNVEWMLGNKEGGTGGPDPKQRDAGPSSNTSTVVDWSIERSGSFGWLEPEKSNTEYRSFTFGDGTRGELYYPKGTPENAKLPTVIWMHGFSYPMGYMWVYRSRPDLHPILALVRAGYAVVGFDQTGHSSRQDEFATFYDRFPHWSRLGRMVSDTRAVIDAVSKNGMCDASKIYLYGYSMGGIVAMHTAALDNRVKGVVSICGFTPMRTDTSDKGTGGLARYSVDLPLMPRLSAFIGNESKVPYDYNELIATVAPRPVYVVAPQLDRDANPGEVKAAVDQAKKIYSLYNAGDHLMFSEPWDYNRLPEYVQDEAIEWMKKNMK